jgi:hypothetical protein
MVPSWSRFEEIAVADPGNHLLIDQLHQRLKPHPLARLNRGREAASFNIRLRTVIIRSVFDAECRVPLFWSGFFLPLLRRHLWWLWMECFATSPVLSWRAPLG